MKRLPIVFSLLAVIALSASLAYWGLQLYKPPQRPMAAIAEAKMADPSPDAAATLFGGQVQSVVATNYQLTGVVAAGKESVAILVADGQPPRALKIGKEIASGVTVKDVQPKFVLLSEGGVIKRIELATDAKAASAGALAAPVAQNPAPAPQVPLQPPEVQPPNMPQVPTGQPMEVPAQPQGVPPPPPSVQMPAPTRTFSNSGGQPPTQ